MPPVRTCEHPTEGVIMSVVVIEFITLDGIVSDPAAAALMTAL